MNSSDLSNFWGAGVHRVFLSYHHANDQWAKEHIVNMNEQFRIFVDYSVNSGDIDDEFLSDEQIRIRVRDEYLRDSSVTVVLVGEETRNRKHVDWELYSSMRDSAGNAKSGVILVQLPSVSPHLILAPHGNEEKAGVYPELGMWGPLDVAKLRDRYAHFSQRMIANIASDTSGISVVPWKNFVGSPNAMKLLIDLAYKARTANVYDLSTPMRRRNG